MDALGGKTWPGPIDFEAERPGGRCERRQQPRQALQLRLPRTAERVVSRQVAM